MQWRMWKEAVTAKCDGLQQPLPETVENHKNVNNDG